MSIITPIKDGWTSDSITGRGVATGITGGVVTGGLTGLTMLGVYLKNGSSGAKALPVMLRSSITGAIGFGTLGALSNVRLSNDRYTAGLQGAGLGVVVGGVGTAVLSSVWAPQLLRSPRTLLGQALIGAAIGGGAYAALGLSGLVAARDGA